MYPKIIALFTLAAFTSAAPMAKFTNSTQSCPTLHVIVARGTCESQTTNRGEGIFHTVANMITSKVPGSDSAGLVYPASGIAACASPTYVESVHAGNSLLVATIQSYSLLCPATKFALVGYSQGGQVVTDAVCGANEKGFGWGPALPPMANIYLKKVVAAISFGNPAYVVNQPYDRGTDKSSNGVISRISTAACTGFAENFRSYCNANDKWCASGNSTWVHGQYVTNNGVQGANFVVARYHNQTR